MIYEPQHKISNSVIGMCEKKAQTSLRIRAVCLIRAFVLILLFKDVCVKISQKELSQ